MQLTPYQIIKKAIVTEKSTLQKKLNHYVFKVPPKATKGQIKSAVEELFKVDVLKVRTMNYPGKFRRRGFHTGYKSDWKKAIVEIKQGQEIKIVEGL